MKFLASSIIALSFAGSAFAALPPYAESAREISAIMESQEVASRFSSAFVIDMIQRTSDGHYVVISSKCGLNVAIEYTQQNPPRPGPQQFKVVPGSMQCQ